MWKMIVRRWKYFTARLSGRFEERADPKVQLEQAMSDARTQHRRLKDQAANVIANQKQTEIRLNRAISELERVNRNARQALLMAEQSAVAGDNAKAEHYTTAAEKLAGRLVTLEDEISSLKGLHFQASQAAEQAKSAVSQSSLSLQEKLRQRQQLLGQIDQARMQEQMNEAMNTLSESVGEDVPTFEEVREKVEARFAKAKGAAELIESEDSEASVLEIEAAARTGEAKARLAQIRDQLGLPAAGAEG